MKKSSILVTLFLVLALVFAVSCPSGVAVSITGTDDISKAAIVNEALEAFTFEISTTGEFLSTAVDKELTIKGLENFSGSEDSAKATATAKIKSLGEADATSKKITTATVEVSAFTAKVVTNGAKELTFAIPAVKPGETATILKDVTSEVAISGKKVLISASNPTTNVVVTPSAASLTFVAGTTTPQTVTFTISPEGATWKEGSLPSITADNGITFAFARTSATVLTLTATPSAGTAQAASKPYEFAITNTIVDIADGSSIVISEGYKASINIIVEAAKTPADATVTGGPVTFIAAIDDDTGKYVTITFDGAKVKNGVTGSVSFTPAVTGVSAEIKTAVADSNSIVITFKADSTTTQGTQAVTIDLKSYVDADDTHTIPDTFTGSVSIAIN